MNVQSDGITWRIARKPEFRMGKGTASNPLNPVRRWLIDLELMGKKSEAKRFPSIVWTWPHELLREFMAVLFSCDGTIYAMSGYPRIEFTVASEALARDVQHALLRFGIVSKFWQKTKKSWRVEITAPEEVRRYQALIGWVGEKSERFTVSSLDEPLPKSRHELTGNVPNVVWPRLRASVQRAGLTVTELARRCGERTESGYNAHAARDIRRSRLEAYATALVDPDLAFIASEDLYWDEIISIEALGPMQVYDLTVPDGSNFLANDICVHNTSAVMNMAENAAIQKQIPVAVFSLEMSKEQLALRLLCSQSEVSLHKVRTGYLGNEDWPRLTTGAGLLTRAPIYIDDSAALSVLEIRAKARRLKSENKLGLIVIDYLQLMRSSSPAENRVQEISQISRGLKALAKELSVPVIALSQLSRAVEQRGGGGRPQLSDLRDSGCVTADTRVLRADTGAEVTMGELLASGERNIPIWTIDSAYRLVEGTMSHVFPSGIKEVFEMKLASGRSIKASANHPFLTSDGWRRLDQLEVGRPIGTMRWATDRTSTLAGQSTSGSVSTLIEPQLDLSDSILSIESLGEQPVFDATVPGTHNFVANGMVVHNSIEQDADVVLFVYREVVYKPDTPEPGKAQLIIAKQRNGPTDDVDLTFLRECTKFVPYSPTMSGETEPGF
jgi:replicative DNA helicase